LQTRRLDETSCKLLQKAINRERQGINALFRYSLSANNLWRLKFNRRHRKTQTGLLRFAMQCNAMRIQGLGVSLCAPSK